MGVRWVVGVFSADARGKGSGFHFGRMRMCCRWSYEEEEEEEEEGKRPRFTWWLVVGLEKSVDVKRKMTLE